MAETPGPRRRVTVHLIVPHLIVPIAWRVGAVTFLPPGRLLQWIDRDRPRRKRDPDAFDAWIRENLDDKTTTAAVPAWTRHLATGSIEEEAYSAARNTVRDSIAVLRLFHSARARLARYNVDHEFFGLVADIGSAGEFRWVSDPAGRFIALGFAWQGSIGSWEVPRGAITEFRADRRFTYLDKALRTRAPLTDWQRRILGAVRTMAIATPLHRPAQRIVLAATALEALFGKEFLPGVHQTPIGGHQLARRAAFLWCGAESNDRHGSNRPACPFLTEPSERRLNHRLGIQPWDCSYYDDLRALYDDRNAALHGADSQFSEKLASRHEFTIERVLLEVLGWVTSTGATTLQEYEDAIAALPTV